MLRFRLYINNTKLAELLYISMKARPGITIVNIFCSDWSCQQEYDCDYTGEYVCRDH